MVGVTVIVTDLVVTPEVATGDTDLVRETVTVWVVTPEVAMAVKDPVTRLLGLIVGVPVKTPEGEAETRLLGLTVGVDISETETIDVSEIDGEPD